MAYLGRLISVAMDHTILLTSLTALFFVSVSFACPSGFTTHENNCYVLLPVPTTWAEALRLCDAVKAKLAWIENGAENTFIVQMLKKANITGHSTEVWLGGTDMLLEGMWMWADDMELIQYTNWFPNEPNNAGNNQHCLGMMVNQDFKWDDYSCSLTNYPLCKRMQDDGEQSVIG
ncbi:perlucin-like [Mytilus trossulus]|uniref:perlucin-like n=1 Tax=Mytilus trossulus TaxID=6551 RepID=UPI003006EB12